MTSVRLVSAMVICVTFGVVLAITVTHEHHRHPRSAPLPDWRGALGSALVDAGVMVGAVVLTALAILLRNF